MTIKILFKTINFFTFLLIYHISFCQKTEIIPRTLSLQIGSTFQLKLNSNLLTPIWYSNNPNILISQDGIVSTSKNYNTSQKTGKIYLYNTNKIKLDSITVTLVKWNSNYSKLEDKYIYTKTGSTLYLGHKSDSIFTYNFSAPNRIYLSLKDFDNYKSISAFHKIKIPTYSNFLFNQFGFIIKDSTDISFSNNLKDWTLVYKTRTSSFRNSICQYFNTVEKKSYIFTGDYHTIDSLRSSVYRGEISSLGIKFEPVFTFYSRTDALKNNQLYPQTRHIHTVKIDPYTNDIWVATGDEDKESFLMYSSNNGDKWNIVGTGSQDWRVISIWFSKRFIYWSVDTWKNQKVYRIPRSKYIETNNWPSITPIISNGNTKPGIKYYLKKKDPNSDIPYKENSFFIEDKTHKITPLTELISCNDPANDYRESVADIENSAYWFCLDVQDKKGDKITLLSSDAEGKILDDKSRVFGFKEREDGSVDVQEVYSIKSINNYSQLIPCFQNSEGSIFYWGYYTDWLIHKMELNWNDQSNSIGGYVLENDDPKKNSSNVKLKLTDYEGKILKWQKCDQSFEWEDIIYQKDTITLIKENGTKYYRAIVKEDNSPPVSSFPLKITSLNIIDSTTIKKNNSTIKITPNPTKDIVKLKGFDIIDTELKFEMYNTLGQLIIIKTLIIQSNILDATVDLNDISHGTYIIKISGKNMYFTQKIQIS